MAAKESIGEKPKIKNQEWFDQECIDIINKKNVVRQKLLQRRTRISFENYCELRREAKRVCRKKKKEMMLNKIEGIDKFSLEKSNRKLYKELNWFRKGFQPRLNLCKDKEGELLIEEKDMLQRWTDYFKEILNRCEQEEQEDEGEILYRPQD